LSWTALETSALTVNGKYSTDANDVILSPHSPFLIKWVDQGAEQGGGKEREVDEEEEIPAPLHSIMDDLIGIFWSVRLEFGQF